MRTQKLKILFLSILFFTSFNALQAQDSIYIEGPIEVCFSDCPTYFFIHPFEDGDITYEWFITSLNGEIIWTSNSLEFSLCEASNYLPPGIYEISVNGVVQGDILVHTSIEIYMIEDDFIGTIESDAHLLCPANDSIPGGNPGGCEKICAYSTVTYILWEGSGGINTVDWVITGAENYTINWQSYPSSVTVEWGAAGQGLVEAFTYHFCQGYSSICVDILEDPVAAIDSNPAAENGVISICEGQAVYFENRSTGASTYLWNFGAGSSEEVNPSFTYASPGTYEVTLVAFNECLCSDTTSVTVEVINAESPILDCVSTICAGETITYTADAACGTYTWDISANGSIVDGGGATDDFITIEWNSGPEGTIELTVEDCSGTSYCLEPTFVVIPIISDNATISGPDKVCKGQIAHYSLPAYEGTTVNWTVSPFGTITAGQGTHSITVEWFDGTFPTDQQWVAVDYDNCFLECGGSSSLDVDILPEFFLTGPIEVCANASEVFSAINTQTNVPISCNWSILQNGTTLWTSAGSLTDPTIDWVYAEGFYTLIASPQSLGDYCFTEYEIQVRIVTPPPPISAIEGETNICPGGTYAYEAVSGQPENNFRWEINNGGTVSTRFGNPISVNWGAAPPYSLSVVQISTSGIPCESDPLTLDVNAIGTFTISGDNAVCQDQTSILLTEYYEGVDYDWTILPATAGTIINDPNANEIEILWHETGAVSVQLTVCSQSVSYNLDIYALPKPVVNHPLKICANDVAIVQVAGTYDAYTWKDEFGNILSTDATPSLGAGHYQVIVENQYGCLGDTTFYIDDYPPSEIWISTPGIYGFCAGDPPVTIYALNSVAGYSYQWYHDGNLVGTDAPTYTTDQYGNYWVEITDANGCKATSNYLNLFEFCGGSGGVCTGGTCTLTDCDPGTLVSFNSTNAGECHSFNYQSVISGANPTSLSWNFDDPDSGTANNPTIPNPSHTYSHAGFYVVLLTAWVDDPDNPGSQILCWDAQLDTVTVAADFDVDNACAGVPTQFDDISTFLPFATITGWDWDFGDPASGVDNISTTQFPSHIFATEGNYDVTLTVTSDEGCTASITKSVLVYPAPTVSFDPPEVTCAASASRFVANVDPSVTYVEWDFGDPTSGNKNQSELFETFHLYENPGNYTLTLYVESIYGCSNSYSTSITIEPNTLNGIITLSGTSPICEGDSLTLSAPPGGISWMWSDSSTTEQITIGEEGVYGVSITDDEGCTYSPDEVVIEVIPAPESPIRAVEYNDYFQPIAYFYDNYQSCYGQDIFLETIENVNYSYSWSNGDIGPTTGFTDDRGNLLDPGAHDVFLNITDNMTGCTNVIGPFVIQINPLPQNVPISASNTGLICEGTETTFSVISPDAGLTYLWSTGQVGTSITAAAAGEYFVTAITDFGCESESSHLNIVDGPDITKIPAGCHTRCSPDTICLPDIPGIVSYQWYFEGAPVPAPDGTVSELVIDQSGDYYVEMESNIGCTLSSDVLTVDLLEGYGTIQGTVYADVNENGVIDGGDTIVSGVEVQLLDGNTILDSNESDIAGVYAFSNILSRDYTLQIDTLNLPQGLWPVWDKVDTTMSGCDVLVELDWLLQPYCPEEITTLDYTICEGKSINYNGMMIDHDTSFTASYINLAGCDSLETVHVEVLALINQTMDLFACRGSTLDFDGQTLAPGDQMDFTYTAQNGCDSLISVTVNELLPPTFSLNDDDSCPDSETGVISYENVTGTAPFTYSLNGADFQNESVFDNLGAGDYTPLIRDANGCEVEAEISIDALPALEVLAKEAFLPCSAMEAILEPEILSGDDGTLTFLWEDGSTDAGRMVTQPGTYSVQVRNECETLIREFTVESEASNLVDFVYIPNVFSPNNDGINDVFELYPAKDAVIESLTFRVFDRWGNQMFDSSSEGQSWDGKFKDNDPKPGVYVWYLKATLNVCGEVIEVEKAGDVAVVR